jgi:hypothetical protein
MKTPLYNFRHEFKNEISISLPPFTIEISAQDILNLQQLPRDARHRIKPFGKAELLQEAFEGELVSTASLSYQDEDLNPSKFSVFKDKVNERDYDLIYLLSFLTGGHVYTKPLTSGYFNLSFSEPVDLALDQAFIFEESWRSIKQCDSPSIFNAIFCISTSYTRPNLIEKGLLVYAAFDIVRTHWCDENNKNKYQSLSKTSKSNILSALTKLLANELKKEKVWESEADDILARFAFPGMSDFMRTEAFIKAMLPDLRYDALDKVSKDRTDRAIKVINWLRNKLMHAGDIDQKRSLSDTQNIESIAHASAIMVHILANIVKLYILKHILKISVSKNDVTQQEAIIFLTKFEYRGHKFTVETFEQYLNGSDTE